MSQRAQARFVLTLLLQVSNQCTALVEAEILCPTRNNPELAWVRETPLNESQYITEVQYSVSKTYDEQQFLFLCSFFNL